MASRAPEGFSGDFYGANSGKHKRVFGHGMLKAGEGEATRALRPFVKLLIPWAMDSMDTSTSVGTIATLLSFIPPHPTPEK